MTHLIILIVAGLTDSVYLTVKHFSHIVPPCTINSFLPILSDCGKVLTSRYSTVFGIPLALFGIIHYSILLLAFVFSKKRIAGYILILESFAGAFFSLYFMYLQLFVIVSICIYCSLSALISFFILITVYQHFKKERFELHNFLYGSIYEILIRPILFLFDAESIHEMFIKLGKSLSKTPILKIFENKLVWKNPSLKQKLAGIEFDNPIGLAAGFDYNADLTMTLPSFNFGFTTAGTVSNNPYPGNPKPRLGRLVRSLSLMVNKGLKNQGAKTIIEKLKTNSKKGFIIPVGISIGITPSPFIKTLKQGIKDICLTFKSFEKSGLENKYYELNISCPNLYWGKSISFYPSKNLNMLLKSLDKLKLKKPVFVKMPIDRSKKQFQLMLETIAKYHFVKGVIIGNLQKNRSCPDFYPGELNKYPVGNFSGQPCRKDSNKLIKITYKKYGKRFIIIGCGGIFSARHAYEKIRYGASLVQLITGMIFKGPQLISQINMGLSDLLEKDKLENIRDAVGLDNQV